MILPNTENAFEIYCLNGIEINDFKLLENFNSFLKNTITDQKLISQAVEVIIQSITTLTLPLLWTNIIISNEKTYSTFIHPSRLKIKNTTAPALSIEKVLNKKIFTNRKNQQLIKKGIKNKGLVSIKNAFDASFAELMRKSLDQTMQWRLYEKIEKGFHYHHHNLYDFKYFPPELLTARLIFDNSFSKKWIEKLSSQACSEEVSFSASYYMPGDHSLPHDDNTDHRVISFVWHLSKDWQPEWGGGLFWSGTGDTIMPSFNTLNLFEVNEQSFHMVTKVAPTALEKRLTVNGWWRSENIISHKPSFKQKKNNETITLYAGLGKKRA